MALLGSGGVLGSVKCMLQEATNVVVHQQGDAIGQAEEVLDMAQVAATTPGLQVGSVRGTR